MAFIRIDRCPNCGATLRERTTEQNSKLHALLRDIAEQKLWGGQRLDTETVKRLMVSAFERANGRSAEIYPALDGQGYDVVARRTSRMSKKELSELLEFATAWAIENDITLHDSECAELPR